MHVIRARIIIAIFFSKYDQMVFFRGNNSTILYFQFPLDLFSIVVTFVFISWYVNGSNWDLVNLKKNTSKNIWHNLCLTNYQIKRSYDLQVLGKLYLRIIYLYRFVCIIGWSYKPTLHFFFRRSLGLFLQIIVTFDYTSSYDNGSNWDFGCSKCSAVFFFLSFRVL